MRKLFILCIIGLGLGTFQGAFALNCYMTVSGPAGAVPTDENGSWVQLNHIDLSFANSVDPTGRGGRFSGGECRLSLDADSLILDLFSAVPRGEQRDIKIQVVRPTTNDREPGQVLSEFEISGSLISDISLTARAGSDAVSYSVALVYSEIRWVTTYFSNPSDPSSILALETGFDFIKNELLSSGSTTVPDDISVSGGSNGGGNTSLDRDNDGMPNSWETSYAFNPDLASDATGDPDQDGFTNLEEYLTGTHPRQASSYFRTIISSEHATGTMQLAWNSVPGKSYTILATDDLSNPFSILTTIQGHSGNETTYTVGAQDGAFFKVEL